ncbi:MAG: lipopolysaccharide biosynthesis protein [Phycisphaerae bacterium]
MNLFTAQSDREPILFRPDGVGASLGFYLPATMLSRFMGLIRGVVLTWLISESQYGLLQIALLSISILHPLLGAGFNEAMTRYVPQYETRGALRAFLARALAGALLISVVSCGLAWLVAGPLGRFLFEIMPEAGGLPAGFNVTLIGHLAVAATFCLVLYFLMLGILRGLRMFRAISAIETVYQVGFTVVAVAIALLGWKSAQAMLICYAASVLATVLLFSPSLVRMIGSAADQPEPLSESGRALLGQMLRFSIWAALAALMWQTLQYYPVWYLHKVCGREGEVTGIFAAMRLLAQAVLVIALAVVTVVQTSATKTWESRGQEAADRLLLLGFKATALVLLGLSAVLAVSARLLVMIYPSSYAVGRAAITPSLLNYVLWSYLLFQTIHFTLIEKTRHVFVPWCLGLLCTIVLSKWLVQPGLPDEAAILAAAWAGVLGITPAMLTCLVLLKLEKRPFDFGTWLLLAAACVLALPLPLMVPIMGLVMLLAAGTTAILNHEEKRQIRDFLAAGHGKARQILSQLVGWM